jgi:hypothetical protein
VPTKTKVRKKQKKSKTATAGKKTSMKKKAVKTRAGKNPTVATKRHHKPKKQARKRLRNVRSEEFSAGAPKSRSGRQSGDLQGLSMMEGADSESVADLVEEGNAFEAEVIAGVEAADADTAEVRTHEVPEDDVPEEYFDKD